MRQEACPAVYRPPPPGARQGDQEGRRRGDGGRGSREAAGREDTRGCRDGWRRTGDLRQATTATRSPPPPGQASRHTPRTAVVSGPRDSRLSLRRADPSCRDRSRGTLPEPRWQPVGCRAMGPSARTEGGDPPPLRARVADSRAGSADARGGDPRLSLRRIAPPLPNTSRGTLSRTAVVSGRRDTRFSLRHPCRGRSRDAPPDRAGTGAGAGRDRAGGVPVPCRGPGGPEGDPCLSLPIPPVRGSAGRRERLCLPQ